jgi:hypothetical protein
MADLQWRDAIQKVLALSTEAMHYTAIAEAITMLEYRTEVGATPANSVNSVISKSIADEGDGSPFVRESRGHYRLRSATLSSIPPSSGSATIPESHPGIIVDEPPEDTGFIKAFGMYWARDSVLWVPNPKILGQQQTGSTPVDFCEQRGVYLLHDGRAVVYVGRTTDQALGTRLRQHITDRLNGRWDRFSWFGIYSVSESGSLSADAGSGFQVNTLIATMEALLIEGLEPPQNRKRGDDFKAAEFLQVEDPEIEKDQILKLMERLKAKL